MALIVLSIAISLASIALNTYSFILSRRANRTLDRIRERRRNG